jgi:tetratricopeptide (TPR) repeat protein
MRENDPPEFYRRAAEHYQQGRLLEALAVYDEALVLAPEQAEIYCNRGIVLIGLKRLHEGLASIENAIALSPDSLNAWRYRCMVLEQLGRYEDALGSCERVIALAPGDAYAQAKRGYVLIRLGRYDEALRSFERSAALKPDQVDAYRGGVTILNRQGRHDEALAWARNAQKISANPLFFQLEADCLAKLGQYEGAYAIGKQIDAILHGKDVDHHEFMSAICGNTGRCEEGRRHGGIALKLKDVSVRGNKYYAIPSHPPGKPEGGCKIISYSLFGAQQRNSATAQQRNSATAQQRNSATSLLRNRDRQLRCRRRVAAGLDLPFLRRQ